MNISLLGTALIILAVATLPACNSDKKSSTPAEAVPLNADNGVYYEDASGGSLTSINSGSTATGDSTASHALPNQFGPNVIVLEYADKDRCIYGTHTPFSVNLFKRPVPNEQFFKHVKVEGANSCSYVFQMSRSDFGFIVAPFVEDESQKDRYLAIGARDSYRFDAVELGKLMNISQDAALEAFARAACSSDTPITGWLDKDAEEVFELLR